MNFEEFIKPELLSVAAVCYFLGMGLKNTTLIKDKYIPLTLGAVSVVICLLWVLSSSQITGYQTALMAVFTAITQGILLAGASTYINQLVKQSKKEE